MLEVIFQEESFKIKNLSNSLNEEEKCDSVLTISNRVENIFDSLQHYSFTLRKFKHTHRVFISSLIEFFSHTVCELEKEINKLTNNSLPLKLIFILEKPKNMEEEMSKIIFFDIEELKGKFLEIYG